MLDHMENVAELFLAMKKFRQLGTNEENVDENSEKLTQEEIEERKFGCVFCGGTNSQFCSSECECNLTKAFLDFLQAFCPGSIHPFRAPLTPMTVSTKLNCPVAMQ